MSNAALNTEQAKTPTLELVPVKSKDQALSEIRNMLNSKLRNPAYIYDKLLSSHERAILCYAAKLSKSDINTPFVQLAEDKKISIKKALLNLSKIFNAFHNANALDTSKFIQ